MDPSFGSSPLGPTSGLLPVKQGAENGRSPVLPSLLPDSSSSSFDKEMEKVMGIIRAQELTPDQQHEIMVDSIRNW